MSDDEAFVVQTRQLPHRLDAAAHAAIEALVQGEQKKPVSATQVGPAFGVEDPTGRSVMVVPRGEGTEIRVTARAPLPSTLTPVTAVAAAGVLVLAAYLAWEGAAGVGIGVGGALLVPLLIVQILTRLGRRQAREKVAKLADELVVQVRVADVEEREAEAVEVEAPPEGARRASTDPR